MRATLRDYKTTAPQANMSATNLEKGTLGWHAGMAQPPLPALATNPYDPDFAPQYERNVNDNMRKFAEPSGQLGPQAFDKIEDPKYEEKRNWKKLILIGVLLLLVVLIATAVGIIIDRAVDKKAIPKPTLTMTATVTAVSTSTTVRTGISVHTVLKTKTASASIPTRIAAAASSYLGAESSSVDNRMESISSYLTHSPASSASSTVTLAGPFFSTTLGARDLEPQSLLTSATAPESGWNDLCGLPESPCPDEKAIDEKRHEKHASKVTVTTTVTSVVPKTTVSTTISSTTSWTTTTAKIPESIISAARGYYSSLHSSESSMDSLFATQSTFVVDTLTPTPTTYEIPSTSALTKTAVGTTLSTQTSPPSSASSGNNGPLWCEGEECIWNV